MNKILGLFAAAVFSLGASAAQAQFSDNKVKIGVLDDFSGQFCLGNCMGPVNAVRIAADEFHNKIGDVPIEIIWGDHQNKPDIGVSLANKWYDLEQVDVIVDVVNSSVALAVQNIARSKNKAVLYSTAGSSDLTGKQCAPYSAHWTYDTYQFGKTIGEAVPYLGKSWFIVATDFAYGKILATQIKANVEKAGGKVLGTIFHPFNVNDASSFILQAQASKADVIALANSGNDMTNTIKAAKEFGLVDSGVKIVPISLDLPFVEQQGGLNVVGGMFLPLPWYPGATGEKGLAYSKEFQKRQGTPAPYLFVGLYSAVRTYLLAAQATKTDNPKSIFDYMRAHVIDDAFTKHGVLRPDGRMVHDVYLMQLKKPSESKGPDDLSKLIATIPGDKAFRPMAEGGCPYIKAN
ncbi:MAG TPA: ABC transporter substrate-binding protein [Stellaceae bacterium]|jgi:branched-chain amino acid transport system substrate-binding protein